MSSNQSRLRAMMLEPEFHGGSEDLAELVGDAAKALSIGGSQQAASEVRQVVDSLKHQLGPEAASDRASTSS
ncbi:hypothetical protein [Aureimonas leprariae]|uniref:Uncharacterized protein n=1 Tax=Plantimonas leprariae TaxID=2615207 RepID=A0A7V7TXE8_9HYPH|nr:hypothetical protein [Aureimonas leprariae]KAB0681266.1 hypothetical protein F6X38_05075 [Aureimonas leprariae]